ncbi:hypothetical protein R1flu_026261 [Riccia fluitans]|uniref:Uncharacterized protein n=1 Tax=Riccia fluitans TaxID=41844 RepID=A0ABD1XFG3_9MARC
MLACQVAKLVPTNEMLMKRVDELRADKLNARNVENLLQATFDNIQLEGYSKTIAQHRDFDFLITQKGETKFSPNYGEWVQVKSMEWDGHPIRGDLDEKCPVCQHYIGLFPFISPGICLHKYHIDYFSLLQRDDIVQFAKAFF